MRLYLIRHPQPEVAEGVCYGRSDVPLREPWDAAAIAAALPVGVSVWSSPLQRCRQLAETLSPTPYITSDLQEIDFGAWEMQPWAEIPRQAIDAWAADPLGFSGHGGERVVDLQARVASALTRLATDGAMLTHANQASCAWVTHAGVIRLLHHMLLGWPSSDWLNLSIPYASVLCFTRRGERWALDGLPDEPPAENTQSPASPPP